MSSGYHHLDWSTAAGRVSQYDLLLAAIPLALAVGLVGGYFLSVPRFLGGIGGATVAVSLVGYSVYTIAEAN